MKHVLGLEAEVRQMRLHVIEIGVGRLVGARILGRIDGVELDVELVVAELEGAVVHIRQVAQIVELIKIEQTARGIDELGPVTYRPTIIRSEELREGKERIRQDKSRRTQKN